MDYHVCLYSKMFGSGAIKVDRAMDLESFFALLKTPGGKRQVERYQKTYGGIGVCRRIKERFHLVSNDHEQLNFVVGLYMSSINGALSLSGLMEEFSFVTISKAKENIFL